MSAKVKSNDIFASTGRKKKRGASLDVKKARAGWLFVLPFIIGFVLLYLPIIYDSIKYSFHDIRILTGGGFKLSWVGFENYSNALFVDPNFVQKLGQGISQLILDIPAIVIYVDSTGEHGLLMSATAWSDMDRYSDLPNAPRQRSLASTMEKHNIYWLKYLFASNAWANYEAALPADPTLSRPGLEHAYLSMPPCGYNYDKSLLSRISKKGFRLGASGKENAKIIEQYCDTNNIFKGLA